MSRLTSRFHRAFGVGWDDTGALGIAAIGFAGQALSFVLTAVLSSWLDAYAVVAAGAFLIVGIPLAVFFWWFRQETPGDVPPDQVRRGRGLAVLGIWLILTVGLIAVVALPES